MRSNLTKISFLLLIVAMILRWLSVYVHIASGKSSIQETVNGLLGGLIVSLVVISSIAIVYDQYLGRYKHALQVLSRNVEVYLCIFSYGTSYRLITADENGLIVWRLNKTTPVVDIRLPWSGTIIEKARVNLTMVRAFDGVNFMNSTTKASLSLVLYDETIRILANKPIGGQELTGIIERWQRKSQALLLAQVCWPCYN